VSSVTHAAYLLDTVGIAETQIPAEPPTEQIAIQKSRGDTAVEQNPVKMSGERRFAGS
jgi:hypothetical protein